MKFCIFAYNKLPDEKEYAMVKIRKIRKRKGYSYIVLISFPDFFLYYYRLRNSQKATALAAATFKESTSCDIGMRTV